ncbi:MAG: SGNH/GDSL hydrolase family protein, partial [Anaerolineae bacterium]
MPLERHGSDEQPYYLFVPDRDYNWEGIPVHIGDSGFRTPPFDTEKPANTVRILNVGDSVAFGWEVKQEETYGAVLAAALNEASNGRTYEVINAGVPGWNLRMERDFLLQEGFGYDPDIIVLDLTLVNDVYGAGPAVSENPGLFDWLRDHTYAWPFLTTQMRFLLARQQ